MKIKLGFLAIAIIVVAGIGYGFRSKSASGPNNSNNPPDISNNKDWIQVFSDEFGGDALNSNKWVTCYDWRPEDVDGCTNSGNNEQEWYLPSQVSVINGIATLTATNNPVSVGTGQNVTTYPYRSGMISTGRDNASGNVKWSTTYGYFEARMKLDGGQGVWPAFWLLPTDKSWPPEIDIMEFLGNNPNNLLLTSHWPSANGPQKNSTTITGPNYTNGWHTYAVNWQPNRIDWYVDGVLKKTVLGSSVPSSAMEIIINLAIGGRLPGNANSSTPFPRTLQVQYVHVYEKTVH